MTDTMTQPTTSAAPEPGSGGRVFSGVQPSGLPHVGNHLGAFSNYIAMQQGFDAIYCIVDYHALTSTHDAELIRTATTEMALGLLALGLDPDKAVLFRQSDRLEHIELMWLLASVTPMGWVERTPSFKEKRRNQPDDVNLALFNYPVLQAADIAIYKADYVPVGKDQAAHLELAREVVRAFNSRYGETFPEPQAVFSEAPIVKGTDGQNKMSKSLGNVIEIFADADTIRKQIMSMVTDTQRQRLSDPGRPEVCNVCQMHRIFSPDDYEEIWEGERSATTGCVATKKLLVDRMLGYFDEARERYAELKARPQIVDEVLAAGADTLAPQAADTLAECHERMGLAPRR